MRAARLVAALAAAAALAAPAGAHADPPLPAGWIAGGAATTMPAATPPGAKSRRALQLAKSPERLPLAPVPVALEDLDTVEIAPSPTDRQVSESKADPTGDPPEELFVDRGCTRASISGHAVGKIEVGWLGEPIAPQAGGGVLLYGVRGEHGGDGVHLYARADLETLDPLPDGTLRFTETVARFSLATCKAKVATRFTAIARPLFGGRAFLFRTRCPACEIGHRDRLHVITPGGGFGADTVYEHRGVWLTPGRADGVVDRSSPFEVATFARAVGRPAPALRDGMRTLVGIEAVQGLGEAAPTVIAYTRDEPTDRF
jgi:hypothetical protein